MPPQSGLNAAHVHHVPGSSEIGKSYSSSGSSTYHITYQRPSFLLDALSTAQHSRALVRAEDCPQEEGRGQQSKHYNCICII